MSKYTTEIRFICENMAGYTEQQGLTNLEAILEKATPKIFDFDYPIFNDEYKLPLEKKILKHYYTYEIGFETLALWKLKLNDKLNMIMPYYNQLYESELIKFNPLIDCDYQTTSNTKATGLTDINAGFNQNENQIDTFSSAEHYVSTREGSENFTGSVNTDNDTTTNASGSSDSTNSGSTSASSNSSKTYDDRDEYSDTPQGSVDNLDNLTYLTNARHKHGTSTESTTDVGSSNGTLANSYNDKTTTANDVSTSTEESKSNTETTTNDKTYNSKNDKTTKIQNESNSNTDTKTTEDFIQHVLGKRNSQTYSTMLKEFRETFLNIDKMVIEELNDLFMLIY